MENHSIADVDLLRVLKLDTFPPDHQVRHGTTVSTLRELLRAVRSSEPTAAAADCRLEANVVYGKSGSEGRDLVMHIYHPRTPQEGALHPGVVLVHGGGWLNGNLNMFSHTAAELAKEGFIAATIGYRLSGEAPWPAALEDVKCAVRWFRSHAFEISLDPTKIAVLGGSAGGHLAAMAAITPGLFDGAGGWENTSSGIQAAVLLEPVLDLRISSSIDKHIEQFLRDRSCADEASPITYSASQCPPVLTFIGDQDKISPECVAREFHQKLDEVSIPNNLIVFPNENHVSLLFHYQGIIRSTIDFLSKYL